MAKTGIFAVRKIIFPASRMNAFLAAFVALLVCLSCSGTSKTSEPAGSVEADLILSGGRIFTGVPGKGLVESIAIKKNIILAVGDSESVLERRGPDTVVLDLKGRSAVPGFHDAHIHLYYGSLSSLGPDLLTAITLPLVLSRVAEYARSHPDLEWVMGSGWYFDILPGGSLPSKEDLDGIIPDRPVMLTHISGHYIWVNCEALRRVGIDPDTPDPPGGIIGRDPLTGEPNGLLFESAMGLVYGPALDSLDQETITQALLQKINELNEMGITSVDEIFVKSGEEEVDLSSYLTLQQEGQLTCRINLFLSGDLDPDTILWWKESLTGHDLRLAGLKVFVDGNFQGHTAWLLEPYTDQPETRGEPIYSQEELDEIARMAQCMGIPVKFHAIGDAAVRRALNSIEAARSSCPEMESSHSVEHVELLDPEDLDRFAALDAVATVQPVTALFSTNPLFTSTPAAVGSIRSQHLFPNRTLKEAGIPVLFSTDWPAVPFMNPMITVWTSMIRQGETSPDFGLPLAPHAFTLEETLSAYTFLPAKAIGRNETLGTLEKGKFADLVVFSHDIFSLSTGELLTDVQADLTLVDGKIVFLRENKWPETGAWKDRYVNRITF